MKTNVRFVSFEVLLFSMILLLLVPTLVSGNWLPPISRLLYSFTMIACLYLVSSERRQLVTGLVLFLPAVVTGWQLVPMAAINQLMSYAIFQCVFLLYVMGTVYRYLMTSRIIDKEILYASVVLYLMFGLTMGLLYFMILLAAPDTFGGDIAINTTDPDALAATMQELLYFSFVTQTTLGYGDLSPVLPFARVVATFQAIIGQLYIAVVVARLVGIHIATSSSPD